MTWRAELRRLTVLLSGAALLFGIGVATIAYVITGQTLTLRSLAREICAWIALAMIIPPIIAFIDALTRRRYRRPALIAFHIAGFVATVLIHCALYIGLLDVLFDVRVTRWRAQMFNVASYDALLYPLIVAAVATTRQRRRTRRAELASARLERRVAEAELEEMRVRLDPQQVLADLAELQVQVAGDPAGAEQRIHEISNSLREKLQRIRTTIRPARRVRPDARPPFNIRRGALLVASAFGLYLAALLATARALANAATWRDVFGIVLVFVVAGVCAAAAVPWIRGALGRRQNATARAVGILTVCGICIALAALVEVLMLLLRRFGMGRPAGTTFDLMLILAVVLLYLVVADDLRLVQRESRLRAERLASELTEAQLRSLKTQLGPHFLFNTLNSVLSLVPLDPAGAQLMLERLRALLRTATDHRERQEVTVREDLEMTRSYLEIEKVRFRDAIDVKADIDETLLDARVPAFVLQPLVENAIRHGALSTVGRGTVHVIVALRDRSLRMTVQNDGELLDPSGWRDGIGLSNTRARLAQMYGSEGELAIETADASVKVHVRVPLRFGTA